MDERKQYLYQLMISWRTKQQKELLDLECLCEALESHILIEEDETMFPMHEVAYYVLYPDGKSCIVIDDKVDKIYHSEIIAYSLLRIELIKKFHDLKLVQQLSNGTIMESFFSGKIHEIDDVCVSMMLELLVPSSEISVSLYQTLNAKKVDLLSNHFQVRPQLIIKKYQELSKSARGLLRGVHIRDDYQSSILNRYLRNTTF